MGHLKNSEDSHMHYAIKRFNNLWLSSKCHDSDLLKGHLRMIEKFPHRVSKTMPKEAGITPHD